MVEARNDAYSTGFLENCALYVNMTIAWSKFMHLVTST